jgi:hypothetical protein
MDRRQAIRAALAAPFLATLAPRAEGKDYADAAEALLAIDRLEADVATRLRALARALPAARPFADSCLSDHDRHRRGRERLRARLRVAPGAPGGSEVTNPLALDALRKAQEALVYAHAEGLPVLADAMAVDALARDMVDLARHLTVIDLWIESEAARG